MKYTFEYIIPTKKMREDSRILDYNLLNSDNELIDVVHTLGSGSRKTAYRSYYKPSKIYIVNNISCVPDLIPNVLAKKNIANSHLPKFKYLGKIKKYGHLFEGKYYEHYYCDHQCDSKYLKDLEILLKYSNMPLVEEFSKELEILENKLTPSIFETLKIMVDIGKKFSKKYTARMDLKEDNIMLDKRIPVLNDIIFYHK